MTPELTSLAQIIGVAVVSALTYWAAQRKAKTTAESGVKETKDYADNLINTQSARVTDLERQVRYLENKVDELNRQLNAKENEIGKITRERDIALENQRALQQELKDSQAALAATLQRADDMERRLESLEKQQIGGDAVRQFVDQVMILMKAPPVLPTEVKPE